MGLLVQGRKIKQKHLILSPSVPMPSPPADNSGSVDVDVGTSERCHAVTNMESLPDRDLQCEDKFEAVRLHVRFPERWNFNIVTYDEVVKKGKKRPLISLEEVCSVGGVNYLMLIKEPLIFEVRLLKVL
ncbi:hypothetical protein FCM35_KLT07037 [Carex littledalei]|uniref:Uncharacterized protein n=1 Tax=Carex littledalei TaxID=544730 RepID=A0A833R1V3_9POAL|nr:hypothetical protein FCM35_KLT07037 [Carex littledalei]